MPLWGRHDEKRVRRVFDDLGGPGKLRCGPGAVVQRVGGGGGVERGVAIRRGGKEEGSGSVGGGIGRGCMGGRAGS